MVGILLKNMMGSVVYPYLVLSELEFIDYESVAVHYSVLVIMNALNRPTCWPVAGYFVKGLLLRLLGGY